MDQVSVSQYWDYMEIIESPNINDFDKRVRILVLFAGVPNNHFDEQTPKEVEHLFKSLEFLQTAPVADLKEYYQIGKVKYRSTAEQIEKLYRKRIYRAS